MSSLWSPVVATGGNQRQIDYARKRGKQAKSVAVDCHRLPATFHGKEGVDGSSPSEGSAKAPQSGAFWYVFSRRGGPSGPVWSRLWSFRAEKSVRRARESGPHGISRSGRR